jgi:aminopeptidase-like protein
LLNYSVPKKIKLKKKELIKHIYFLKEYPNAIPYITSYYKKRWGFCISYSLYKKILKNYSKNDLFYVNIDSELNNKGYLNYAETLIQGRSKKEIFLSTYVCHPSMANNELSGPLVATALYNYFCKKINNYSIRFVFVPETIGSIAYISKNYNIMKKNIVAGFNLTCLGDEKKYSFLPSKYDSESNRAAKKAFKELNIKYKFYSFLTRGSDERQYNSPGIDLPIASIMRSKYGTYKEYHTSKDDFNFVTIKGLNGGFSVLKKALQILLKKKLNIREKRKQLIFAPKSKVLCEPQMSKRNLYPTLGTKNMKKSVKDIMNFLQFADGTNSLKDISNYIHIKQDKCQKIYQLLKKKLLVT